MKVVVQNICTLCQLQVLKIQDYYFKSHNADRYSMLNDFSAIVHLQKASITARVKKMPASIHQHIGKKSLSSIQQNL